MGPRSFTIRVEGHPEPAGSKRGFAVRKKNAAGVKVLTGKVVVIDANETKKKPWQREIRDAVRDLMQRNHAGQPLLGGGGGGGGGPLVLGLVFHVKRPKYHYSSAKKTLGQLKPDFALARPTSKPDLLKLARGVEDALTGVAYLDDAQIVDYSRLSKRYCVAGEPEGVEITVAEWVPGMGSDAKPAMQLALNDPRQSPFTLATGGGGL